MKSLKRLFSAAPEGTAALFFIQIFCDARLRRPLLDAGPLRDEASAALGESGHDVDGRVWRLQLRPAPLRRLPGRPLPLEPESLRRGHGAAGHRLRVHCGRHGRAVLRRPRFLPHRQRPERHLHQYDADAALYPGGPAPRRSLPLELRRHERRLLRRVHRRRLLPGDRELCEPFHLRDARQLRRHHPRRAVVEDAGRPQHTAARGDVEAVPAAPARRHRHSPRSHPDRVVDAPAARHDGDADQGDLRRGRAHADLPHAPPPGSPRKAEHDGLPDSDDSARWLSGRCIRWHRAA